MDFEPALAEELSTIVALNSRIYPITAPEELFDLTQPYCIYTSSEGMRTKTMAGYSEGKTVPAEINIIAPRYGEVKSIMSSVIDLLVSFEGRNIGADGPYIQSVEYEPPVELWEEQPKLYRNLLSFEVYF